MSEFWKILNQADGGEILDVACGNGQFIGILQDNLRSFKQITGLDIDDSAIEEARGKFGKDQFTFLQGNSMNIPFPADHFDTVSLSKGLHHLQDVRQSLQEMLRVLKKSGLMIISEMYSDGLTESQKSHLYYHHLRVEVDRYRGISHNYTFRKSEILDLVQPLNLKDITIHDYTENRGIMENAGEYINRIELWKEYFRDSDQEMEMHVKVEALKQRFKEVGLARPPQLVIMGYKRES
jgi:ubiquinone/menaquinone biosynthesis C-methylase UbiE